MNPNRTDKTELILWALLLLPLLWFAAALAQVAEQAHGLAEITALLSELIQNPAALHWCQNTPKFLLAVLVIYPLAVYCYKLDQADRRPGEEHGSAHWGSVRQLNAKYQNRKDKVQNYIFSQNIRFSTDSQDNIGGLYISMHDSEFMECLKCFADLNSDVCGFRIGQSMTLSQDLFEADSLHIIL